VYRRNLYNNNKGNFFTFCAPEGFIPENQPVNIVDIFNKYQNPEKKYIFTLRDELTPVATILHPRWDDSGSPSIFGTDRFNFGMLPSGVRLNNGLYENIGLLNFLWTSSISTGNYCKTLYTISNSGSFDETAAINSHGFSVRAVRQATTIEQLLLDGSVIQNAYIDADGNIYTGTKIGLQIWTRENLKTTKYVDGSPIPTNLSDAAWAADTTGAMAVRGKSDAAFIPVDELTTEELMVDAYGRLYNWHAVENSRGLIDLTDGWHVPTKAEFAEMINYLITTYPEITSENVGDTLKSIRQVNSPYIDGNSVIDKFSPTYGSSILHGYEIGGQKYETEYDVYGTKIVGTNEPGDYSEIFVSDTSKFSEAGIIRVFDKNGWGAGVESYYEFIYTSKTPTSFIGESQNIPVSFGGDVFLFGLGEVNVLPVITITGRSNWIIVSGSNKYIVSGTYGGKILLETVQLLDVWGHVDDGLHGISAAKTYEWLYCGVNVEYVIFGGSGLGYGSVKYIHLESSLQLRYIGYANFYGVPLTGKLNIPWSIKALGSYTDFIGWAGFDRSYLTSVSIHKDVSLIVGNFNLYNTLERFDCHALVAPTFISNDAIMYNHPVPLHIKYSATGYDVAPWTDTTVFSQIIRDL